MSQRVSDIFRQKLAEIQSRLPVKIKGFDTGTSFQEYLDGSVKSNSQENSPGTALDAVSYFNLQRTKSTLSNSTASIPTDNDSLMAFINNNINNASNKYSIDANLIKAVIQQESGYNPRALSSSGAQGLMQLMPGTATSLGVSDPWDISQNIDGGVRYLKDQLTRFKGDISLALAAYNAGPNSVSSYGGIPPYRETQNYVEKVLGYYNSFNNNK